MASMKVRLSPLSSDDWPRVVPGDVEPAPAAMAAQRAFGSLGYEVQFGTTVGRVMLFPRDCLPPELPSSGGRGAFVVVQSHGNRAAVAIAFQRVLVTAVRHGIERLDAVTANPTRVAPHGIWESSPAAVKDLEFQVVSGIVGGTHWSHDLRRLAGFTRIRASVGQIFGLVRPSSVAQPQTSREAGITASR